MDFTEKTIKAANTLMSEATLDELRELARDLRALSPDSALAELVEAKIEQISTTRGWD
jgi:signal transduction histidine kinase